MYCDQCGHSNGNHAPDIEARCMIQGCKCDNLMTEPGKRCRRCNQDTSEYETKYAHTCGACRDELEAKGVFFDLDDDPYRETSIGPWKVSYCCYASAKGAEAGIVCRACYGPTEHFDGPARLDTGDRFGRRVVT